MTTLYAMCGLSFAGKSWLARRLAAATGAEIVSYDRLYATAPRAAGLDPLAEWWTIVELVEQTAEERLAAGRSVVVDNLNEQVVDLDRLRAVAGRAGAETLVVWVDTPLDVIAERRRRNDEAPARGTTGDEQFEFVRGRFEPPAAPERFVVYRSGADVDAWLREHVAG